MGSVWSFVAPTPSESMRREAGAIIEGDDGLEGGRGWRTPRATGSSVVESVAVSACAAPAATLEPPASDAASATRSCEQEDSVERHASVSPQVDCQGTSTPEPFGANERAGDYASCGFAMRR